MNRVRVWLAPLVGVAVCLAAATVAQGPSAGPRLRAAQESPPQPATVPLGAWATTDGRATLVGRATGVEIRSDHVGPVDVRRRAVPVTPGSVYTGTFAARASSSPTAVSATLSWFTANGTELRDDGVRSGAKQDRSYQWTRYTVAGLAPAQAVTVQLGATLDQVQPSAPQLIEDSSLTARPQGSAAVVGPLVTRGNTIRDRRGDVVVLRGLNRPGLTDGAAQAALTDTDIARIKAWGGNVVRLPLNEQLWMPGCGNYDPSYPKAVDRAVRLVTSRDMVALLDLHVVAPTCSSGGLNPLPDRTSLGFWRQVAARYRSSPLVAFNLYNEPHDVSATAWRDGGTATTADGTTYRGVGMLALYRAVRATGAQNLVLVDGLDRSSTLPSTAPIRGTNLVWSVHAYVCDVPWACRTNDGTPILDRFRSLSRTLPVVITEFGHPTSQTAVGAEYNEKIIAYAAAHHWGWTAWAWDSQGTCRYGQYFGLISSTSCATGTGTYEPSPTGIPVLVGLAGSS